MTEPVACEKCGSLYEVTWHKSMMRDKDHHDCNVCGYRMDSWNSSRWPSYNLIERKEPSAH